MYPTRSLHHYYAYGIFYLYYNTIKPAWILTCIKPYVIHLIHEYQHLPPLINITVTPMLCIYFQHCMNINMLCTLRLDLLHHPSSKSTSLDVRRCSAQPRRQDTSHRRLWWAALQSPRRSPWVGRRAGRGRRSYGWIHGCLCSLDVTICGEGSVLKCGVSSRRFVVAWWLEVGMMEIVSVDVNRFKCRSYFDGLNV